MSDEDLQKLKEEAEYESLKLDLQKKEIQLRERLIKLKQRENELEEVKA
jgi:hypothetical protein